MEMEKKSERMAKAVEEIVNSLEKNFITPQRKRGFLCGANCCDKAPNSQALQQCIQNCEHPSHQIAQLVDGSLKDFQARLQRCAVRCQDQAQESLGASPSDGELQKAQAGFESCTLNCLKEYEKKLPKLQKDIEQQLSKIK